MVQTTVFGWLSAKWALYRRQLGNNISILKYIASLTPSIPDSNPGGKMGNHIMDVNGD
jgi:hypothetical protein